MSKKSTSKAFVAFAVALILALAALSVYEYMRVDTLVQESAQAQSQNTSLTTQLQTVQDQYQAMQSQFDALQTQYQALQSQYKALQDNANASKTSTSQTTTKSNKKIAYLTFDDGPSDLTPHLLNVLKDNNVKATFFVSFQNEDTPRKREILKQEVAAGNTIGIHCFNHSYSIYATEQSFLNDFNKMMDIITETTGINPKICRFPGGIGNTVSITHSNGQIMMPTLVKDVEKMGIMPFDWNAGGQDAETPTPTSDQLVQDVLNNAHGQNNVVILLHDTHEVSIDAVHDIVKELRAQGYTFEMLTPDSQKEQEPFAKQS